MAKFTKEDIKIFEESTNRLQEGYRNMREKKTPPRSSAFLGYSEPVTIPNIAEKAKKYFLDKKA